MPVYIGSLGRMIKLPYVVSQQLQQEERYTFKKTLEGKNSAQRVPRGHRSWALTADHFRANESATLQEFADGSWGRGPFWFLSADALVSNVLPPVASGGGPLPLVGGGFAPVSFAPSGGGVGVVQLAPGGADAPIIGGLPVTGSAWVVGPAARVMLQFYSASGTFLSSVQSAPVSAVGVGVRAHVSGVAPANAARVRVTARDASYGARPAISWTDSLQPYGDGQGCAKAVVHGVSRDQVLAVPGHTFSNLSFTVTEVG